ncbi:hypothetical protein [Streptomyces monashensis]|uniref:hypothetical protein n=1 Tax=Streptomyces monashensis TaxID=1678012 RepID=UPI0015A648B9|nr:hypothetical protein [Streptomyces monashensis]
MLAPPRTSRDDLLAGRSAGVAFREGRAEYADRSREERKAFQVWHDTYFTDMLDN